MSKTTRTALALILPLGFAGAVIAQNVAIDPAVDVNGDGMYSFVEMSTIYPEFTADAFTALDTSGDGLLDLAEVTAAVGADLMPKPTE